MKIVQFDIAHIDIMNLKLKYRDIEVLKNEVFPLEMEEAKTYIKDDKIIFACGIKWIRQGVGQCWIIPSVYVNKYPKTFVKTIKSLIDIYCKKMNIHRLQASVEEDFIKWIEKIDFKREAVLEKMTQDKKDEYLYVKFF